MLIFTAATSSPIGAGTMECLDVPLTQTTDAPTTAEENSTIELQNVTGIGNTNGVTVTQNDVLFTVSGATPSSFTMSWTGSVNGEFVSNFGDQTLTVTGSPGETVTVRTQEVTSVTNFGTFRCNPENDPHPLTADEPGQSFVLAQILITATPEPEPKTPTPEPDKQQPKNTSQATQGTPTNTEETPPETEETDETTEAEINEDKVPQLTSREILVLDAGGTPLEGALVIFNSRSPVLTNQDGIALITDILPGEHNITINVQGNTVSQVLSVQSTLDTPDATVIQMPPPNRTGTYVRIALVAVPIVFGLAVAGVLFLLYRHIKKGKSRIAKMVAHIHDYDKMTLTQLEETVQKTVSKK